MCARAMAMHIDSECSHKIMRSTTASTSAASRSGYNPPEPPKLTFTPALVLNDGATRDKKTGALVFKDHPEFRPNLTPAQVIRAGSWWGQDGDVHVSLVYFGMSLNTRKTCKTCKTCKTS